MADRQLNTFIDLAKKGIPKKSPPVCRPACVVGASAPYNHGVLLAGASGTLDQPQASGAAQLALAWRTLLTNHTNDQTHEAFVREFNNPTSKFRRVLSNIFLSRRDLSTDAFSEDAISFLMADLNHGARFSGHRGHLLGNIATEQFVTERLLPLLSDAQSPFLENLRSVLKQAGSRHGRRYIVE